VLRLKLSLDGLIASFVRISVFIFTVNLEFLLSVILSNDRQFSRANAALFFLDKLKCCSTGLNLSKLGKIYFGRISILEKKLVDVLKPGLLLLF
jgi:hypothetical protein